MALDTLRKAGWQTREYQKLWLMDHSRFKMALKSRQIGYTELHAVGAALEAVRRPGRKVYFVSTNLNKSKEMVRKAKAWLESLAIADPKLAPMLKLERDKATEAELVNGSRIIALPCQPRALRGETGTIRLDEPAHYQHDYEIWDAIAPAISSNPDLRLIMTSTPLGPHGLFYDLWTGQMGGGSDKWSRHEVDVYRAVADGFNPEVLDLRGSYTSEGWAQEFECDFVADNDRYFQNELLRQCFTDPVDWPDRHEGRRYLGIDLAQTRDRSVAIEVLECDQNFYALDVVTLSQRSDQMRYPQQFEALKGQINSEDYAGVSVDAQGEGAGLASFLRSHFGARLIREERPTNEWYGKHIPALKRDMESGQIHLPNDGKIISSFGKIKREITTANNERWRARRDADGHADEFYAFLMGYSRAKRFPAPKKERDGIKRHRSTNSAASELEKYA